MSVLSELLVHFFSKLCSGSDLIWAKMESDKRFQHAQYLISFMSNYSLSRPESQEVTIVCRGGVRIRAYVIMLVSASEFLRNILSEFFAFSDEDLCLVAPDLEPEHLRTFLR